jgi:hypothetical protein
MKLRLNHIVVATAAVVGAACSIDGALDPSTRPDPPPAAAFDADFSFFEDRTPEPGGATTSWQQAIQTVAAARADMEILELPQALLAAATAGPGTRDGDAWRWPYSTTIDGNPYDGELRSTILGNEYDWHLFVTAPGHSPQLTDYVVAQGRTVSGGYEGLWWLADVEAGTDTIIATVAWLRNLETMINFSFSVSDSAGWSYERSAQGHVLTHIVYSQPRRRVTWFPDGTGRSWTSGTTNACWNEDLHDVAC